MSPHQPFPQSFCSAVDADGRCASAPQQACVQCTHTASPAVPTAPHPLSQRVTERVGTCAYQWGTRQASVEQRGKLKWRLLCRDQAWWPPRLGPLPTSVPSPQDEGARADIKLEVGTSAPLPTMQKLQLSVSSCESGCLKCQHISDHLEHVIKTDQGQKAKFCKEIFKKIP